MPKKPAQTTSSILMVRPHHFAFNEQTMASNAFQQNSGAEQQEVVQKATEEFDQMVKLLRSKEVEVIVKQDTPTPPKPDAIFPNNWVVFHHDGDVSLFPMEAVNRRYERRQDILDHLKQEFVVREVNDLSAPEKEGRYLEGTGSIIFDHQHRIAYACISSRTDAGLFSDFCKNRGYEEQTFESVDENEKAVYHTNVIMCIGKKLAVLCTESIRNEKQKERVKKRLRETGHELVEISLRQVLQFAGNMLQLTSKTGEELLVMSSRAYQSLTTEQISCIEQHCRIVHTPLTTIEDIGGGSARCMMAEIFLPTKS